VVYEFFSPAHEYIYIYFELFALHEYFLGQNQTQPDRQQTNSKLQKNKQTNLVLGPLLLAKAVVVTLPNNSQGK